GGGGARVGRAGGLPARGGVWFGHPRRAPPPMAGPPLPPDLPWILAACSPVTGNRGRALAAAARRVYRAVRGATAQCTGLWRRPAPVPLSPGPALPWAAARGPAAAAGGLLSRRVVFFHVQHRGDRLGALAQLEGQLRLIDGSGLAGLGDHLASAHHLIALDQQLLVVGVGRNPAVVVADQNQIAIAFELVAGVGDFAGLGRVDFRPLRQGQIDAVVVGAVGAAAVTGDDATAGRPTKATAVRL